MGLPENAKDGPKGGESRDLTPEGCLILSLSLVVMGASSMPLLRLLMPFHPFIVGSAIVSTGALACGIGSALLRILRVPMWREPKSKSRPNDDLE